MLFDEVVRRLRAAGCVAAEEEAEELVAAAPPGSDPDLLETLLARRELGEPLAWITGGLVFCGHTVRVLPGVFVPRLQSEKLALRAADLLRESGGRAVDLCTGAGAIAVHMRTSVPAAHVVGVDADRVAVACAAVNAVAAIVGDLGSCLRSGAFDVVTAVAPYVPARELSHLPSDVLRYEPRSALDGGTDGLDLVRRVVDDAARLLRPGGWLLLELGGDQDEVLGPTLYEPGFEQVTHWFDEDGDLRGLAARRAWPA